MASTSSIDLSKIAPSVPETRIRSQITWVKNNWQQGYIRGVAAGAVSAVSLPVKVLMSTLAIFSSDAYSVFKRELPALKNHIGIAKSELNRSQLQKVYDVWNLQLRSNAARIKNLNDVLTRTEFATEPHRISKAKGIEDRFFRFEGACLAQQPSTDEFLLAKENMINAIGNRIKETDKYTTQIGNSASSVSRRDYMLNSIMQFACEYGLAGNYLAAAVKERSAQNPNEASIYFTKAIQNGVKNGILSTNDETLYEGLVQSTALASLSAPKGKNRDAVIPSLFHAFQSEHLIGNERKASFASDVHKLIKTIESTQNKEPLHPVPVVLDNGITVFPDNSFTVPVFGSNAAVSEAAALKVQPEEGLDLPIPTQELGQGQTEEKVSKSVTSKKTQPMFEPALPQVAANLLDYSNQLSNLKMIQEKLLEKYNSMHSMLYNKIKPSKLLENASKKDLIGMYRLLHTEGYDVLKQGEMVDVTSLKEEIFRLSQMLSQARAETKRPADFRDGTKDDQQAIQAIEQKILDNDKKLKKIQECTKTVQTEINDAELFMATQANQVKQKTLGQQEISLSEPLAPPKKTVNIQQPVMDKKGNSQPKAVPEQRLPQPLEQKLEKNKDAKKPGLFDRIFGKKEVVQKEELLNVPDNMEKIDSDEELPEPKIKKAGWFW